ncbi:MAG TPA: YfhO family protein, partial [Chloroflexota bacterium]|nr:YfhO family protein [Chloroflexota bacterium]
ANAMAVQVRLGETAVLVVSEIDYPGWTARLDGHPVPILRANGVVRAVLVPPGEHTVEFRFEPPGLSEGEEISMRTARILVALVLFEVVLRLVRGAPRWWQSAARTGRLLARRTV